MVHMLFVLQRTQHSSCVALVNITNHNPVCTVSPHLPATTCFDRQIRISTKTAHSTVKPTLGCINARMLDLVCITTHTSVCGLGTCIVLLAVPKRYHQIRHTISSNGLITPHPNGNTRMAALFACTCPPHTDGPCRWGSQPRTHRRLHRTANHHHLLQTIRAHVRQWNCYCHHNRHQYHHPVAQRRDAVQHWQTVH